MTHNNMIFAQFSWKIMISIFDINLGFSRKFRFLTKIDL